MGGSPWRPCAAITTLRKQVDERWPDRDRRSDGIIGDAAHAARQSDHNPDERGWVHALDIDKDGIEADALADQLIELARTGRDGGRIKNIVWRGRVASGTYANRFWQWRSDPALGHFDHIHISFTWAAEQDGSPFPLAVFGAAEEELYMTPEERAKLVDDIATAAAQKVVQQVVTTGFQSDGSFDASKPRKLTVGGLLAAAYGKAIQAARRTGAGTDPAEVAEAVADTLSDRLKG